jgi:ribosomal protein L24
MAADLHIRSITSYLPKKSNNMEITVTTIKLKTKNKPHRNFNSNNRIKNRLTVSSSNIVLVKMTMATKEITNKKSAWTMIVLIKYSKLTLAR